MAWVYGHGLGVAPLGHGDGQGAGGQGGAAARTQDENCGITSVSTSKQPAGLLLVLDRSNSMAWDFAQDKECPSGSTTCTTRWKAVTLKAALEEISVLVASCSFSLSKTPPDTNNIAVFLDGKRLPVDVSNGWMLTDNNS